MAAPMNGLYFLEKKSCSSLGRAGEREKGENEREREREEREREKREKANFKREKLFINFILLTRLELFDVLKRKLFYKIQSELRYNGSQYSGKYCYNRFLGSYHNFISRLSLV